jgi:hypothetical protein
MSIHKRIILFLSLLLTISLSGNGAELLAYDECREYCYEMAGDTSAMARAVAASGLAIKPSAKKKLNKVVQIAKKIRSEFRDLKSLINSRKSFDLPLGKSKTIGPASYTISIDSLFLIPIGGELCASALIEVPTTGRNIGFEGNRIGFNRGGFTGDARLMLIGNQPVPLNRNVTMVFVG